MYHFQSSKEEVVFILQQRPFKQAALITVRWGKLIDIKKNPSFYLGVGAGGEIF